jgi:hypothetical protein
LKDKVDGSPSPQMAITPFRVKVGFIAQAHAKRKEKKGENHV